MQSTSNYSLNLVEGTDIVNIPVQLNPNFQTIDSAMFNNKQSTVGTATEVVTGTSHAIVRNNPDSDIFRFTATGAWTAGDTMSVDGNSVTVHLADGTTPPTGAYIIGAEVLAVINSSLVTLMIGAPLSGGVSSFNGRTGTVLPAAGDYVAGDIDYDNTGSGLVATDVQSAIDELASGSAPSSVTITADGVKTFGVLLAELWVAIDASELTRHSKIDYTASGTIMTFNMSSRSLTSAQFSCDLINLRMQIFVIGSTTGYYDCTTGNTTNYTSQVPTAGTEFTLYYT